MFFKIKEYIVTLQIDNGILYKNG